MDEGSWAVYIYIYLSNANNASIRKYDGGLEGVRMIKTMILDNYFIVSQFDSNQFQLNTMQCFGYYDSIEIWSYAIKRVVHM